MYAIAKTQAEDDGMKQEIKDAQKKAVKAERARDSLIAQDQPLSEQYKTLYSRYSNAIDNFNASCRGRPNDTPGCQSLNDTANTEKTRDEPLLQKLEQKHQQLTVQLQDASNEAVLAKARVQKLVNYESQLQAAIARMKAQLTGHCSKVTAYSSMEEMKAKCGNVQFDAAASDLPTCTTDLCRQYDARHD